MDWITLAATTLTDDPAFITACMAYSNIERLNVGAVANKSVDLGPAA
ncbi:MAG TPA: hypothetical protein VG122_06340 [Gemmata sp.]|nr:hypothetical protein [Gemmata sp.]